MVIAWCGTVSLVRTSQMGGSKVTEQRKFGKHVWKIMMVLSVFFIVWTLFMMSRGDQILPTAFKLARSSQSTKDIEKSALEFMNMTMLKPLWEGIWVGIFGLSFALGLKKMNRYAWILCVLWAIMLITNAAIQGGYELIVLGWSKVCLQTIMFLVPGLIALASLLISRKEFSQVRSL
jgi:hypothetical protein